DLTHLKEDYVKKRFPRIYSTCQSYGVDITNDLVPVRPAAHYVMGGVKTDLEGRSSLAGLYVAGETACTGVHGANRLASNSLLEGLVFGARAGKAMLGDTKFAKKHAAKWPDSARTEGKAAGAPGVPGGGHAAGAEAANSELEKIHAIMWKDAGIIRNGRELKEALAALSGLAPAQVETQTRAALELRNILQLGQLIVKSALAREESRGGHFRSDFPFHDDEKFKKHSLISRGHAVTFG
ncbi:MAG TPA: FAD-binding protein, partial [Candidatus Acidoferrales bacterium]|nr:FAD-binding protein [Candidatus Acidoferrales bacterium]